MTDPYHNFYLIEFEIETTTDTVKFASSFTYTSKLTASAN